MSGEFSDLVKVYIENLNLPNDTKVKLLASNPKTLADVSLWLENNKELTPATQKDGDKTFNPFVPKTRADIAKKIQLFSNNSNMISADKSFFNLGGLVDTDDASWGLGIDRSQSASQVEYYSNKPERSRFDNSRRPETTQYSGNAADETRTSEQQAQDNAITSIRESVNSSIGIIMKQMEEQGIISSAYNSLKEYFDSQMSMSSVCRVIFAENTTADLLERAQAGNLTKEEYWKTKISTAIDMLTGSRELSDEERTCLEERFAQYTPEELNALIDKIKYTGNEDYSKLASQVDKLIEEGRSLLAKGRSDTNSVELNSNPNSIKSLMKTSGAKELMTFEEVWKAERGVDFNPEAIKEYDDAMAQYAMVATLEARNQQLHNTLKDSMTLVKGNNENGVDSRTREAGERQLETNLLTALKSLYGDNEAKINAQLQEISGGTVGYKDGQLVYNEYSKNNKGYCLLDTAQKLLDKVDANYEKIKGPYSVEDYKNKMASAYEQAYGRKNATQLARAFENDQEEVVGKVRTGVEYAGMGVMVAGMFICPPAALAGALTASFGGIGVEALNEATRKEGLTEEAKKKIIQELMTNAALFAVGGSAGKMGSSAKAALLAKNCPTLMACIADIGVDATMSLLGDMVLTGEIDIEGEGLSQLMSLVAGHVSKGKLNFSKGGKSVDSSAPKNRPDNSKPVTKEFVSQKLGCDEEFSKTIADIIESKPEMRDKLVTFLDSRRPIEEIKEFLSMATTDNIDDLMRLSKNKSLMFHYDIDGNLVRNNFAEVLEIAKANPKYKDRILEIAAGSDRPASDIIRLSEYIQKYPQNADDICELVKSNRNIKLGSNLNNNVVSHIDDFVELLQTYPDISAEIKDYACVQRKANNDTSNPIPNIKRFAKMLQENPDKKDLYMHLAKNPNLDSTTISLLTRGNLEPQYVKDLIFFSGKNYTENAINYNIRLMHKYPELRDILTSKPPEFDFIDKDVTTTPQSTLEKRFALRDNIERIAPQELKQLRQTLGEHYFHKIKWEDIIPENATQQQIKEILSDLNNSSKFFSRIESNEQLYGKNIQWAHEMDIIARSAEFLISKGESFDSVMSHISMMYRDYDMSKTLDSNQGISDRRQFSGVDRSYVPDSEFAQETGFGAITPFDEKDGYKEYYKRLMKLLNVKRKPPYPDVELTQVSMQCGYGYVMGHPKNSSVSATMAHARERYEELSPLIEKVKNGGTLTAQEKAIAHDKISEIYFLTANAMPYHRGSNGIADIFMRSIYKELGIEMPALKQGVSLDLEAFTMDMDEYKKKWLTFYEK